MVYLAYLITLLSGLVSVSHTEEVSGTKNNNMHARWLGSSLMYGGFTLWGRMGFNMLGYPWLSSLALLMGGACFGGGVFLMSMALGMGGFFAKAADQEIHSVSRQAIHLDADQLLRWNSASSVTCHNSKCVAEVFSKSQCLKAAQTLRKKNLHSASSGNCQLLLHNSKDKVAAKEMQAPFPSIHPHNPDQILQKAVHSILHTCGEKNTHPKDNKPAHIGKNLVVMLLTKC
ncbi:hypothetical protein PTTG_28787 [Puccinia triticina 1-1 BBBD Race 1]|uniref:Copper transporter n=1 Tax=Puccinia triticina (isolate 1-1 / race 1 (BBBD)) TaxID=630390 RepID=A0A180G8Y7_PUCT1|nr:hypothetical protein PTTG_28787 [Puccinia triticina 1-1 BBBD Race 1]